MTTQFCCYLGDAEFDYLSLEVAKGHHATELGDAVSHFLKKYPDRSWRLFIEGHETEEPLYIHSLQPSTPSLDWTFSL
jgi:hypothetical protein